VHYNLILNNYWTSKGVRKEMALPAREGVIAHAASTLLHNGR